MAQAVTPATGSTKPRGLGDAIKAFLTYSPNKVNPQVIVLFCRQLSSFVRVGVPVTAAVETFAEQAPNRRLRDAYLAVASDIQRGVRLSDAFAAHPRVFPRIVADMTRSAEATGSLDVVLRRAATHIERQAEARQKVKAAMTYPAIIFTFAIVIAVGIVAFVLPRFKDLYASLGVKTPGILDALLGFSSFIRDNALILSAVLALVIILLVVGARTERGHLVVDQILVSVPVVAPLLRAAMIEQLTRTLGDMLGAGVPIGQTYSVVLDNVRNRVYRNKLAGVAPALAAGQGMYRPLAATGILPPTVIQLFRVGEETGNLDSNLAEAADMYANELDYRIKRLTAFLEPAMIVFVGLIVGFVAVTLILSIYSLAGNYH